MWTYCIIVASCNVAGFKLNTRRNFLIPERQRAIRNNIVYADGISSTRDVLMLGLQVNLLRGCIIICVIAGISTTPRHRWCDRCAYFPDYMFRYDQ